jgi:YVTN family beta-propeller protein
LPGLEDKAMKSMHAAERVLQKRRKPSGARRNRWIHIATLTVIFAGACAARKSKTGSEQKAIPLSSSKLLMRPVLGNPHVLNSFPTAAALSPDGRYLAILNNGFGTEESGYQQSIAFLDLTTNEVRDFPDSRLGQHAHQTYFLGIAFSADGRKLYASMCSLSDPEGKWPGDTGNGIAVYKFEDGRLAPDEFVKIPLAPLAAGKEPPAPIRGVPAGKSVPYPAGLAIVSAKGREELLVAENLADDAILLDPETDKILFRFPLSTARTVPAAYPYGVVVDASGTKAFCSLWNASEVAELNLVTGRVERRISLLAPKKATDPGSHPTAMLLSPDGKRLYVALSDSDRVAVIDTSSGQVTALFSTELPGEKFGGTDPEALAQSSDGKLLFVADAMSDALAVFDVSTLASSEAAKPVEAQGFAPTEWYPTALAVHGGGLFIVTGKGEGTGPNSSLVKIPPPHAREMHPYIATLIHGSVARIRLRGLMANLPNLTREVLASNLMIGGSSEEIHFARGSNPIHHVIYIIKENRTYDQIFGDLKPGNGDPSLVLYGDDITPNQHQLALQFGVIDNFYDSGEVSGDGHVWSTAAINSDYNEKTWEINYRGRERTYDYEGEVLNGFPLKEGVPDVDEPGTGYIWGDVARHGLTHRNYGEFVATHWCDEGQRSRSPKEGTPLPASGSCRQAFIRHGERLPANVGDPRGGPSPWPWPVPQIAWDEPTKPQLAGHFDPRAADFRLDYPDQFRADEFLNEFRGYVKARETHHGKELPQFIILRLPDDHTAGTSPGMPTPSASVADNDLAVGRVVEAVSHSPYWDDTAIFILEDDAQNGADHVDAHRSTALVISKYSPGSPGHPFVDSHFYTTVGMIRTMEVLLGLPPMNNNDAQAPVMAPLFSAQGNQPPFTADDRNRNGGLIYRMNSPRAPRAKESAKMDFSHADAANANLLNAILWRDRKGNTPMPKPVHRVFSR